MDSRRTVLNEVFNDFLDRYSPPRHMHGNEKAMQAEANALFKVVMKFAPKTDYENWLNEALERLAYQMKTRAWPTVNEVGAVLSNESKRRNINTPSEDRRKGDLEIAADRMNEGGAVAEGYLYGARAVALEDSGMVPAGTMRAYRSAWFFKLKDQYGGDKARQIEASALDRHEKAKVVANANAGPMPTPEPKRMTAYAWDGA